MKKVILCGVLTALMSGCSINIHTEENQRQKTEEEMYEIMHTYVFDNKIQEKDVEQVQIVSCSYDITDCNSTHYKFIYPEKEMNLGVVTDSMNKIKDFNEVEDKSEPYSLSERITLVSPDENNDELNFVFRINEEHKLYGTNEKVKREYSMKVRKNAEDVSFFKDRAILVKWL
tara:strand:+ start:2331 stop:2849 length:519 start_codon:yes stop_codon:yes gene_type:complete